MVSACARSQSPNPSAASPALRKGAADGLRAATARFPEATWAGLGWGCLVERPLGLERPSALGGASGDRCLAGFGRRTASRGYFWADAAYVLCARLAGVRSARDG